MKKENIYYDKNGKEIKEFSVLKIYHFLGVNEQGRGRKHYYMYKWITLKESQGKLYYYGLHLSDNSEKGFWLKSISDENNKILNAEVVQ